jgi:hypothetical protein
MIGHPAPQIWSENPHHLHQRHQHADLCGSHALIRKKQTGVRREHADETVVRKEKESKIDRLLGPR